MKKTFAFLLAAAGIPACAQYLPNNEFDNWKSQCDNSTCWQKSGLFGSMTEVETQRPGVEPEGWNGSNIKQTYIATVSNADLVTKVEGKTSGSTAVKMVNVRPSTMSDLRAPGFVSLAKPWVYPHTKSDQADGGVYGSQPFAYKPDAITVLAKQVQQYEENAHIIAYIWAGTFRSKIGDGKNPSKEVDDADRAVMGRTDATQSGTLIAYCDYELSSYANADKTMDWKKITIPLTYTDAGASATPEKVNVIFSAADYWNRNNIHEGNELYIDNANFVYYHALSSLSYDGKAVSGFDEDKLSYDLSTLTYDAAKLSYVKKGVGATVETSYDYDGAVLTITVKGNDYAANSNSVTTYKVQFAQPKKQFTSDLSITSNGITEEPSEDEITLTTEADGSVTLSLDDFVVGELEDGEDMLALGSMRLTNVKVEGKHLTAEQDVTFTDGSEPAPGGWKGPGLGAVRVKLDGYLNEAGDSLTAQMELDLSQTPLGMVKLVFAPTQSFGNGKAITTTAGLANIEFKHWYNAGWNTLCVPFTCTADNLGADIAQEFVSADGEWLRFSKLTTLEANKPYLVYVPEDCEFIAYFGGQVADSKPVSVTHGDFTFTGLYTTGGVSAENVFTVSQSAASDKDLWVAAKGGGSKVTPSGAYFTAKDFAGDEMKLYLEDVENGINSATAAKTAAASKGVYSLQGVKLSSASSTLGLPAGVYVVDGKKTVVK